MKEKIGVVLTSAVLVAGCEPSWAHGPDTPSVLSGPPTVDTHSVADTLPDAVSQQIPNVIAYKRSTWGLGNLGIESFCSGVRVGQNDYLTAGHCGKDDDNGAQYGYLKRCEDTTVSIPNGSTSTLLTVDASSNFFNSDLNQNDRMLVHTAGGDPPYENPVHYADSPVITPGTPLYIVNFEPKTDGQIRTPGYDKPVIFGAVALGTRPDDGQGEALMGIKSYGADGEAVLRDGGSGGPVFDANGNLVGDAVSVVHLQDKNRQDIPNSVQAFDLKDGVDITGLSPDAIINVMSFQPITAGTIADHRSQLQPPTATSC